MLDWITSWLESLGYFGVFALMVLEHLFPPIPSELVMPLSGFISSRSTEMNLTMVIVAGSLGSLVGTLAWYFLGLWVSQEQIMIWVGKYGHWMALKPKDIERAFEFFNNGAGHWLVGFGRVVPGVRTYVSVPAGVSKMHIVPYLISSGIGTVIWTAALAIAGYVLGDQFEKVAQFIAPISKIVLASLAIFAVLWFIRRKQRRQQF